MLFKYISLACIASVSTQVIARRFGARAKKNGDRGRGREEKGNLPSRPSSFFYVFVLIPAFVSVEKAFSPHGYFFGATKIGVFFFPQATVTLSNLIVSMHDYP